MLLGLLLDLRLTNFFKEILFTAILIEIKVKFYNKVL